MSSQVVNDVILEGLRGMTLESSSGASGESRRVRCSEQAELPQLRRPAEPQDSTAAARPRRGAGLRLSLPEFRQADFTSAPRSNNHVASAGSKF